MYDDIKPDMSNRIIARIPKFTKRLYGISAAFWGTFVPNIAMISNMMVVKRNMNPMAIPVQLTPLFNGDLIFFTVVQSLISLHSWNK